MSDLLIQSRLKPSALQSKQLQRKLFESELKQRYNAGNKRKNRTEADEYVQDLTPVQHGSRVWQRKFIQQSVFLPAINKKQVHDFYGNESRYRTNIQQIQQSSNTLQTESQTMEYLNQCQKIIQNLKKLTDLSEKKLGKHSRLKGKTNYLYQNNDRHEINRKNNDRQGYLKKISKQRQVDDDYKYGRLSNKINSKIAQKQRGPSFLAAEQSQSYKSYQQKTKRIVNKNGKYSPLAHTLSIRNQQFMEHQQQEQLLVPPKKFSTGSNQARSPQKSNRSRKRNVSSHAQQYQQQGKQKKLINKMSQGSQFQGTAKLKVQRYKKNPQEYQVQNQFNDNNKNENDQVHDLRQAEQIQDKAQQMLKKVQKKQKYLMKYLNKANKGGFELHKRILQFSNKSGRAIRLKSKQNKKKEQTSTQAKTDINKSEGKQSQEKVNAYDKSDIAKKPQEMEDKKEDINGIGTKVAIQTNKQIKSK